MTRVVDASVAVKWFFVEDDSAAALQLVRWGGLVAPDLLLIECRNAAVNKFRRGTISREEAVQFEANFAATRVSIVPSGTFLAHAFELALNVRKPIYDCVYLAVAIALRMPLITADLRFAEAVDKSGIAPGSILLLSYPPVDRPLP